MARPEEVAFRGGGFAPRERPWTAWATLLVLLALWQAGSMAGLIPGLFLPSPAGIARELVALSVSGELWSHLQASLLRLAVGWTAGTIAGIALGVGVGLFTALRSPAMAVVSALFPIPKIALVPLFIIWFGIGEGSKIATIGFGVFFPTVIGVAGAVDNLPRSLIRMGQSFGLSRWRIVRKIVLPGALPAILSNMRITAAIAIVLLVAAEMIGARRGIGAFVLAEGNLYDMDGLLAGIVVLSVMGLVVSWAITRVERALLGWR